MSDKQQPQSKPKLLFVDDEPGIRLTLPKILELHGFEVAVCASVAEALRRINEQRYDVLLADLNIGEPGDGFTIISAMRRSQPHAATIMLTGFPAFEVALEAIRKQVDDYIVKPADIGQLIQTINERLNRVPREKTPPLKRVAHVLDDSRSKVVDYWLQLVNEDPELAALPLSNGERAAEVSREINRLIVILERHPSDLPKDAVEAAMALGRKRFEQGYSVPAMINEVRLLRRAVYRLLEESLLKIEISYLVPEMVAISDYLDASVKVAVESYLSSAQSKVG